jgi:hypothetical protein
MLENGPACHFGEGSRLLRKVSFDPRVIVDDEESLDQHVPHLVLSWETRRSV